MQLTPTRSCKPSLKQFCVGNLTQVIGIICNIHKVWSIKILVVILLSIVLTKFIYLLLIFLLYHNKTKKTTLTNYNYYDSM